MENEKIENAIKEVGREIGLRKNLYPKWIQSGRLTQQKADEQIENMSNAYEILKSFKQANAQYNEVVKQNQSLQAELEPFRHSYFTNLSTFAIAQLAKSQLKTTAEMIKMQNTLDDINFTLTAPSTSIVKTFRDIRAVMNKYNEGVK